MKYLMLFILLQFLSFYNGDLQAQWIKTTRPNVALPDSMTILWVSESIYNTGDFQSKLSTLNPNTTFTNQRMTFGGNQIGLGLMSLSDSVWDKPIGGTYELKTRGTAYSAYDALITQYLRNDANGWFYGETYNDFAKAYDKLIGQGVKYFKRVIGGDAPPQAYPDRHDWQLNVDPAWYKLTKNIPDSIATKYGIQTVSIYQDWLNYVSSGQYTVMDLMNDAYHESTTPGVDIITDKINTKLISANVFNTDSSASVQGSVITILNGTTYGTWANTNIEFQTSPYTNILLPLANMDLRNLVTKIVGDSVVYPDITCEQIWIHFVTDGTSGYGGKAEISIDNVVKDTMALYSTLGRYPKTYFVSGTSYGKHKVVIKNLFADSLRILGVTYNGVKSWIPTDINEDKNNISPKDFLLLQNYPNPFNPITIISYSLPSASNVRLIVYNILGQTVKVLDNGFKNAGNYSITFKASNLPSGIYFYKLEAGQFSQIKKMMLIK